jgi:hypothetical protein
MEFALGFFFGCVMAAMAIVAVDKATENNDDFFNL